MLFYDIRERYDRTCVVRRLKGLVSCGYRYDRDFGLGGDDPGVVRKIFDKKPTTV